jgi:hypothetical protein
VLTRTHFPLMIPSFLTLQLHVALLVFHVALAGHATPMVLRGAAPPFGYGTPQPDEFSD